MQFKGLSRVFSSTIIRKHHFFGAQPFLLSNSHICVHFSSVTQSCPTLCDPMNCSTPGLTVHHQLPEFTQTHVHRVGDAIQPSHSLSSPSPPALIPPSISVFSNESTLRMKWPKYWSFSLSISPSNEYPGLVFRMDWLDLLAVQGTLKSLLQYHTDDTTLMAESEEELKSLLMKVKEESEKWA